MDPLSIAASASSIAGLCGTVIVSVSRFVVGVRTQDQTLAEFTSGITTLKGVLDHVESVLRQRPRHLPFAQKLERRHWLDIKNVLEACNRCLYKLNGELPEPASDGNHETFQRAKNQIHIIIKSNLFVEIRGHIASYTQILQLSLTTVSLGSMWAAQQSQEVVRSQIQSLTAEIRTTNAILQRSRPEAEQDPGDDVSEEELSAARNIEAWRESAESLAAAVTLYEPDEQSIAGRPDQSLSGWEGITSLPEHVMDNDESSQHYGPLRGVRGYEKTLSEPDSGVDIDDNASDWDPEPEATSSLSVQIIEHQIAANRTNVDKLLQTGLYSFAERFQRKGIELQDQLLKLHKVPFPNRNDEEERLADILIKQRGTRDGMARAKDILRQLLDQEVKRKGTPGEDKSRQWRLYFKLSSIYLEFGFVLKAKLFATRALEGRRNLDPMPKDLVLETATLLIKACQQNQDFDEAEGIRRWIHELEADHDSKPPPDPAMADVLRWCKDQGFDVESPCFQFEQRNADGKTPLHLAVSDEKLKIVEQIVDHTKTLETRDNDSATALLLACSTRNRKTTEVLLKKGAKVDVYDRSLKSPLHRVQSADGGVATARLILDEPSRNISINQKDGYDKTALHLACEFGNDPMVTLLHDRGADLNIRGPAGSTPLHLAITARRLSTVRKLLDRGADTTVRDDAGHDALATARAASPSSHEIKKLIHEHDARRHSDRPRRVSYASTVDDAGPRGGGGKNSLVSPTSSLEGGCSRRGTSTTLVDDINLSPTSPGLQRKESLTSQTSYTKGDYFVGAHGLIGDGSKDGNDPGPVKMGKGSKLGFSWGKKGREKR